MVVSSIDRVGRGRFRPSAAREVAWATATRHSMSLPSDFKRDRWQAGEEWGWRELCSLVHPMFETILRQETALGHPIEGEGRERK